jgi:hypothetical protein
VPGTCELYGSQTVLFRPNGPALCQPRATPWEMVKYTQNSPDGAALITPMIMRVAPMGLESNP